MTKKIFNPADWLQSQQHRFVPHETECPGSSPDETECPHETEPGRNINSNIKTEVEHIIQQLEAHRTDLTATYSHWRDIGFAFAQSFGEEGREFFHRVSRFHPAYSSPGCDNQYNNCLKSTGSGITIKTFFYLAAQAGANNRPPAPETAGEEPKSSLPVLPRTLFPQLPQFLQKVVEVAKADEERDILLLGSLV